jgi:two-component system, LuxR family, response regulator FixJ
MVETAHVVVIDDDEAVLDSLRVLLEAEGFEVETFDRAHTFLECSRVRSSGCLVTDVRMPDMDGLELLQALSARGPLPAVIVITGHGEVPLAVQATKLGAHDFIEKPFDPHALLTSIHNSLAAGARPAATANPEIFGASSC